MYNIYMMETSFIPKKDYSEKKSGKKFVGLSVAVSSFVFVAVLVASAGVYFYKGFLESNIVNKNIILEKEKGGLDLALIQKLSKFDKRVEVTKEILNKHTSLVHLFSFLEKNTLKEVMFDNFNFEITKEGYMLTLDGKASSYAAIAIQSDILGKNKNIINPIFSDLGVNTLGDIIFTVSMKIDPKLISYKDNLSKLE